MSVSVETKISLIFVLKFRQQSLSLMFRWTKIPFPCLRILVNLCGPNSLWYLGSSGVITGTRCGSSHRCMSAHHRPPEENCRVAGREVPFGESTRLSLLRMMLMEMERKSALFWLLLPTNYNDAYQLISNCNDTRWQYST